LEQLREQVGKAEAYDAARDHAYGAAMILPKRVPR
jgi:hypothetical protein